MSTEKERETHVYMAKLAEQAERYDGNFNLYITRFFVFASTCIGFFLMDNWVLFVKKKVYIFPEIDIFI